MPPSLALPVAAQRPSPSHRLLFDLFLHCILCIAFCLSVNTPGSTCVEFRPQRKKNTYPFLSIYILLLRQKMFITRIFQLQTPYYRDRYVIWFKFASKALWNDWQCAIQYFWEWCSSSRLPICSAHLTECSFTSKDSQKRCAYYWQELLLIRCYYLKNT